MNYLQIKINRKLLAGVACGILLCSCKKYLGASPSKNLVTITSVSDLQGLMDNYNYMNIVSSEGGDIAADNYFLSDANYNALPTQSAREAYLWQAGEFDGTLDWQNEYSVVYNANVVLDNIGSIARTKLNATDFDNCIGEALVFRAKSFLEISQIWAKGFDSATAASTAGIPLRLNSDYNTPSTRASLLATYRQIISDLQTAIPLLPQLPAFVYRPSRASAYGLLGRTYLMMRDYAKARLYADSSLQLNSQLLDFNTLASSSPYPFAPLQYTNPEEMLYTSCGISNYDLVFIWSRVDTMLYQSYQNNDLRTAIYFTAAGDGYYYFQGSWAGNYPNFNGLGVDEMYLTRAEGAARAGDITNALADLNTLLVSRWVTGTFTPLTAASADSALSLVLTERRKELVNRMLRLGDIKRLNLEGANISVTRIIGGQTYTLPPNDPRFALPIPTTVIQLSGMVQN